MAGVVTVMAPAGANCPEGFPTQPVVAPAFYVRCGEPAGAPDPIDTGELTAIHRADQVAKQFVGLAFER